MNSLDEILQQFRSQPVFFEPVGGNHGDTLIELGSRHFLSKYHLDFVTPPDQAQLIIVNGSGSFAVELWSPGLAGLRKVTCGYPQKTVVVLPSSYQFDLVDFPGCFEGRESPAYLFARELASYERIARLAYPASVFPLLHHDMAFELAGSPFLHDLKKSAQDRHVLLIERFDREATTHHSMEIKLSSTLRARVPAPLKRLIKSKLHLLRRQKSGFTSQALDRLYSERPEFKGLPVIAEDVSSKVGFTFEQFLQTIAQAAVVISNRLHAAILSTLLEKPTIVLSGHPYGKLESSFDYSLKKYPNASLW